MKGVKRVARGTVLVAATLWFALSCGTVWASEPAAPHMEAKAGQVVAAGESTTNAAAVTHTTEAAAEHGAAHHDSLSPADYELHSPDDHPGEIRS